MQEENQGNEETYIFLDHCNTIYNGDIGEQMAQSTNFNYTGFEDVETFRNSIERLYRENQIPDRSAGLAQLLSETDEEIPELLEKTVGTQEPQNYGEGFLYMPEFLQNSGMVVVTAGWEDAAAETIERRMQGEGIEGRPMVVGSIVSENCEGLEVGRYCSGDRKLDAIDEEVGIEKLYENPSIALGNSSTNDGPMMQGADISIGTGRAREVSDVFVEDYRDFYPHATLTVIADAVLKDGEPVEQAEEFISSTSIRELPEAVPGGKEGQYRQEVLDAYEEVRGSTQCPEQISSA